MKLNAKSVLFGFGLGIILSASVTLMMSSTKNNLSLSKQQLTDAEIIKRAKELGWVDSNEFVQVSDSEEMNQKVENESKSVSEEETAEITIKKSESSEIVTKKLKKAGLIQDEKDFRKYIKAKGLHKKIRTGTFKIKKGVDYKTIMNILTKSKT